jgi:acetylglutamate kinase
LYCFELKGVLENFEDKNSVISSISKNTFASLKEKGIVSKGMIPKLENALDAVTRGVGEVVIFHASDIKNIVAGQAAGTRIHL